MKLKRIFACLLALNMTLSVSVPVPEVGVNGKSVRAETVTLVQETEMRETANGSAVGEEPRKHLHRHLLKRYLFPKRSL